MNQALSFGLLLAGGVLLEAALTGHGPGDVLQGKAGKIPTQGSQLDLGSALSGGVAGIGGQIGNAISGVGNAVGYVNPLSGAHVTPERIDMGVDYAGSGNVSAIGDAVVTQAMSSGSGWPGPGGFVEYKLTSGPDAGVFVYVAEGVAPLVKVGQQIKAGTPVAQIIPGSSTGIETGLGSGQGSGTYASGHGGYSEGQLTAAGQWFSDLIQQLGGPPGTVGGRSVVGPTPPFPLPGAPATAGHGAVP